ncbi:hypothetical protein EDD85DRAFT_1006686 [Armillaria nabsnona]|nr:hypothetical protein EDD85DRAFT_1006686 [Armillaria nabsnona]
MSLQIPIYSYNDNPVSETPTLVEVADDASCARMRKTFAAKTETIYHCGRLHLWTEHRDCGQKRKGELGALGKKFDIAVKNACVRDEFLHIPAYVQLTAELMRTASQISTNQSARQGPTGNVSSQLLNVATNFQEFNPNKTNSDHILEFRRRSPPTVAAGVMGQKWAGATRVPFHGFTGPSVLLVLQRIMRMRQLISLTHPFCNQHVVVSELVAEGRRRWEEKQLRTRSESRLYTQVFEGYFGSKAKPSGQQG